MNKIKFKNLNNETLVGILSLSPDRAKHVIILCHGFEASKNSNTYIKIETKLLEHSIATFRFDFHGRGKSEGNIADTTISKAIDDIRCAVIQIKKLGFNSISLFGSSFGGISILNALPTLDIPIKCVVLKSPVSNYIDLFNNTMTKKQIDDWQKTGTHEYEKKLFIKYTLYQDALTHDTYSVITKIDIPIYIIHGDADEIVPIEQSKKLFEVLPNTTLEIIPNCDHRYSNPEHFTKFLNKTISFFIKELN